MTALQQSDIRRFPAAFAANFRPSQNLPDDAATETLKADDALEGIFPGQSGADAHLIHASHCFAFAR
ncbi:hypothetical protein QYR00_07675 [Agrobacterium tumefaciens]|nr:hypothetical protein QYR00_07675 [Agrobacterium tumefaciens]